MSAQLATCWDSIRMDYAMPRCKTCPGCQLHASSIASDNSWQELTAALSERLQSAEHYIELSHRSLCDAIRAIDAQSPIWRVTEAIQEAAADLQTFDGDLELPEMKEDN